MKRKVILKEGLDENGKSFDYFTRRFNVPLYGWTITIVLSTNIAGARDQPEFVKRFGVGSLKPTTFAFCESMVSIAESHIYLPLHPTDYRVASLGTVAHESMHATWNILDTVGVGFDEEAHAYLLEFITQEVDNFSTDVYYYIQDVVKGIDLVSILDKEMKLKSPKKPVDKKRKA